MGDIVGIVEGWNRRGRCGKSELEVSRREQVRIKKSALTIELGVLEGNELGTIENEGYDKKPIVSRKV